MRALIGRVAVLLAASLLAAAAGAQEAVVDPEDESPAPPKKDDKPEGNFPSSLSGYAWSELAVDTRLDNGRENAGEWRNHFLLRLSLQPGATLRAVASARLRHWTVVQRNESAGPFLFVNGENARSGFEALPDESFLEWLPAKSFRLRAGLQTFHWGQSEVLSPADPINPRDMRWGLPVDPAELKIPVFAVSAVKELGPFHVEAAWIPFHHPMRAWAIGHDFALFAPGGSLPIDLNGLLSRQLQDAIQPGALAGAGPDASLRNSSAAVRIGGRAGGVDFGAGYYFGWDKVPEVRMDAELAQLVVEAATPNPRLVTISTILQQLYPRLAAGETLATGETRRQHQVFGDVGTSFGDFVARAEAGFTSRQTLYAKSSADPLYPVRHPAFAASLGLEYRYGQRLFASAQLYDLRVLGVPDGEQLFQLARHVSLLTVFARYAVIPNKLELRTTAVVGLTQAGRVIQPLVVWRVVPDVSLAAGASLWDGDGEGPGSYFDRNDAVFVRTKISF